MNNESLTDFIRPSPLPSASGRTGSSKGDCITLVYKTSCWHPASGIRHPTFRIQNSEFRIPYPPELRRTALLIAFLLCISATCFPPPLQAQQTDTFTLARIKYRGGGDWYNDPSALKNLIEFVRDRAPVSISEEYHDVALGSRELFDYPFAFLTGHGTIAINRAEASNLREYLDNGGFLYVDDDYGLDEAFYKMVEMVYPDEELIELPFEHPIYHQLFDFPDGLPKIHEHDGKAPRGFGLFRDGRLVLFYTDETNLADGWTNADVHNDPAAIREKALQMGTNILVYVLTSGR